MLEYFVFASGWTVFGFIIGFILSYFTVRNYRNKFELERSNLIQYINKLQS